MSEISAALVKELRDATGAPMMDCKRALQETNGDLEAARTILRERGMAQAAKRAGRETTEGLVGYRLENGTGTMVAVGSETEPVSKNDEFQDFAKKVLETVVADGIAAGQTKVTEKEMTEPAAANGNGNGAVAPVEPAADDAPVVEAADETVAEEPVAEEPEVEPAEEESA